MTRPVVVNILVDGADAIRLATRLEVILSIPSLANYLNTQVEPWIQERGARRFASEGDDVSGKWEKLRDSTVAFRLAHGFGGEHPINVRTGELKDYIENSQGSIDSDGVSTFLIYPGTEPVGELSKKMKRAQAGDYRTVPRPVLGMNKTDFAFVLSSLEEYIRVGMATLA